MQIQRILKLSISLGYWLVVRALDFVRAPLSSCGRDGCIILYYHGVTDAQKEQFRQQMEWLKSKTKVVSVAESASECASGWRTCITFDDAFDSVRCNAVPILEALALPGTVFAVSGNLGRRPSWELPSGHPDSNEVVMSADQLLELPNTFVQIGSHTVTHPNLTLLSLDEVRQELIDSKRELESLLVRPVETFSVPFGEYSPEILDIAEQVGYKRVLTCEPELACPGSKRLGIGRFKVSPDDWMLEFKLKALGAYRWRCYVRSLRRIWAVATGRVAAMLLRGAARRTKGSITIM